MAQAQPQKMNWWYQSIIEWMIENPDQPLKQCAADMGVTQSWLSCIIHSDAFQVAYYEARDEHFANTSHNVVSKMEGVALQAATLISERLEEEGENIPLNQLNSTAETALKALGYTSTPKGGNVQVNVNNELGVRVSVDQEALRVARERMHSISSEPTPSPVVPSTSDPKLLEQRAEPDAESLELVKVPAPERV